MKFDHTCHWNIVVANLWEGKTICLTTDGKIFCVLEYEVDGKLIEKRYSYSFEEGKEAFLKVLGEVLDE